MLSIAAFKKNPFCRDSGQMKAFFLPCHITNLLPFFENLVPSVMKCLVPQLLTSQQAILSCFSMNKESSFYRKRVFIGLRCSCSLLLFQHWLMHFQLLFLC